MNTKFFFGTYIVWTIIHVYDFALTNFEIRSILFEAKI